MRKTDSVCVVNERVCACVGLLRGVFAELFQAGCLMSYAYACVLIIALISIIIMLVAFLLSLSLCSVPELVSSGERLLVIILLCGILLSTVVCMVT